MRKILVTALALVALASLVAPATGEPSVRREEFAYTTWMLPAGEPGHFTWYGAYAARDTVIIGPDGLEKLMSHGAFFRGDCAKRKTRGGTFVECMSRDNILINVRKEFEMSPLADSATMRTRANGQTFSVEWSGDPVPGTYQTFEACWDPEGNTGEGQGGGIWRSSDSVARLFGRRFASGSADSAGLSTGGMVSECGVRTFHYDPDAGALRATFRISR